MRVTCLNVYLFVVEHPFGITRQLQVCWWTLCLCSLHFFVTVSSLRASSFRIAVLSLTACMRWTDSSVIQATLLCVDECTMVQRLCSLPGSSLQLLVIIAHILISSVISSAIVVSRQTQHKVGHALCPGQTTCMHMSQREMLISILWTLVMTNVHSNNVLSIRWLRHILT